MRQPHFGPLLIGLDVICFAVALIIISVSRIVGVIPEVILRVLIRLLQQQLDIQYRISSDIIGFQTRQLPIREKVTFFPSLVLGDKPYKQ